MTKSFEEIAGRVTYILYEYHFKNTTCPIHTPREYRKLLDDILELCEENERLKGEIEQLKGVK